jgi:hypothetical protein
MEEHMKRKVLQKHQQLIARKEHHIRSIVIIAIVQMVLNIAQGWIVLHWINNFSVPGNLGMNLIKKLCLVSLRLVLK